MTNQLKKAKKNAVTLETELNLAREQSQPGAVTGEIEKNIRINQRDIWVLEGALNHKLDLNMLKLVVNKFIKIDCVPTGYYYPEFYAKMIETEENKGAKN